MSPSGNGPAATYARLVIRWRWPLVVLMPLVALACAQGASRLAFDNDYRSFFSRENPQLTAFEALERIYTKYDSILFIVHAREGSIVTPRGLEALAELTERGWQTPYSQRVDSIINFQHTRADGDELIVGDLVESTTGLTPTRLAEIEAIALGEPLLRGRLLAADARTAGVNVRLQVPDGAQNALSEAAAFGREVAAEVRETYPELRIELSGTAMLSNAFAEAPQRDVGFLLPVMYGVLLAVMLAFLRSLTGTVATALVIAFSAATAMGLAGYWNALLNGVSVSAPTIILTVAIADSIHVLVSLFAEMRRGRPQREALVESLRINTQPVFLTSLTTVIGFLSLNFSDAPPLRALGSITATGVAAAWVYSMTFLPALLAIVPMRAPRFRAAGRASMEGLAELVIRRRRSLLWGMGTLVALLTACTALFEINDRPVEYFDERLEFRRAADFGTEHLTGVYNISFSLPAGEPSGINAPAFLRTVAEFAAWARARPEVHHVSTITDTVKRLNQNMHADDPDYYRLPDARDLAAQYLLLYEMSLPYGLDLNDQLNVDKSATRIDVLFEDVDFQMVKDFKADAEAWLAARGIPSEGASPAVMFAYIAERNIYAMLRGTTIGFGVISLVLMIALRSLKLGLLSLIPNLVPVGMAFGIWALVFGEVGFAVSIVAGVSIGIIVDDTVHFLSKYLRARREQGLAAPDAVRYAFSTVGRALWGTSLILVIGFAALSQSAFWPNATLGMLTALAIASALIADFLFLPPLLMAVDRAGGET